jgi:hypothetical protein
MSLLTPFFLFYFTFGGYFLFYYQISYGWNKGCEYFMEKIKNLTTTKKLNKFEKYFKKNNKVEVKRNKKPNNALFSFALYFMLLSSHSFFLLLFFK